MFDFEMERRLEAHVRDGRLMPEYDGPSFAQIPGAVRYLLGLEDASPLADVMSSVSVTPRGTEKVVVLLLDGFGYWQWHRYVHAHAFLRRFNERGLVAPLASVFPATTAAALTAIHTGLTPQQHGLLEWMIYDEGLGRNFYTLPFAEIDDHASLVGKVDPSILFDGPTFYEELLGHGIPSFTFTNLAIAGTAYSKQLTRKSVPVPHKTAADLVVNLRQHLERAPPGPAYYYAYHEYIDGVSHLYGPHSEQARAEMNGFFHLLQTELVEKLSPEAARGVSLLVTADHGHIDVDPTKTTFLNDYPHITKHFRRAPDGRPIPPWGSARDCFLAIEPDRIEEVQRQLSEALADKALVLRSEDALRQGFFGAGEPHPCLRGRIGDLLILPDGEETVWYQHSGDKKSFTKLGHHGGRRVAEMAVPLGCVRMEDLVR